METPRRNRLDLNTPAEKAIFDAMQEIEKIGADVRLTKAQTLLSKARDLVADYVDGLTTTPENNPDAFTDQEIGTLKKRFEGFTVIDSGKELFQSTNGGFGSVSIRKENGKVIYYSHAPGDWDIDTGKVHYYKTYKVQYNTAEDCFYGKNGTVLIDFKD